MKRIFLRLKQPLRNERGEITFFACFFVVGIVMLISFLLLYASIRITCINIRNGAKMELNNLTYPLNHQTYNRRLPMRKFTTRIYTKANYLLNRGRMALSNQRGDFYISDAVKIIIAVVLGALLLAALTLIFNDTVIPRITEEIESLFS